jgi:hypothetical protein
LVGGFFQVLKEKIAGISESIKNHLDFVGKGGKLLAELADKAVEMVVNFIVTHPPSAVVKTALRVLETAADKPVIKLLRENVPYADDIIKKISESDTVKGLLKPLHGPVSAVTEMTDTVAGGATKVVTDLETQAIALIGDGAAMITNLGGAGTQVAAGGGASQPAKAPPAGGGFLGAVKRGLHTYLLEFGTQSLLRHGKRLGKAALQKGVSAAKGLIGKLLGPKVPFKVRAERHELWVEDRQGEVVVLVATEPQTIEEEIAEFEARIAKIPDPKQRTVVERAVDNVKDLNREIKASANQGRDIEGRKKRLVRIVAKLLETVELRETSRFAIRDPRVYRNAGRDIVVVETPDGPRAFYKRTGRGGPDEGWAGKGNWVPFDGFLLSRLEGRSRDREWFIKPRTGRKGSGAADEEISRFIAEVFGRGEVHVGEEVTDIGVLNAWLRSNGVDVAGGYRVGDELNFPKGKEEVVGIPMGKVPLLAGRPEAKFVFVEIGAGDLRASIRIAKQGNGTVRVIAVDPASAPASAVQELEALGGQVVRGVASDLPAGTADHVFQYFPWTISGAGSHVEGGTWRLIEDTVGLLKPGGAAHFVTEDKETAKYLLAEANRHGMKGVLTPSTAGAAAPGAGGSGVPDFGPHRDVWQVNVYK